MPRPTTITDEQILEAARSQFFEFGFGASTANIAQSAGISEGSIFKRFSTKAELFQAAMGIPSLPVGQEIFTHAGVLDIRDQLKAIALHLIESLRDIMPRIMMMWAQPNMNPVDYFQKSDDAPPKIVLRALTSYLKAEKKMGRIQCKDPEIMARMIMGSIHNFVFFELITASHRSDEEMESFVDGMLDLLWEGVAA